MSGEDRRNRSDRLKRRFERGGAEGTNGANSESQASGKSKTSKTSEKSKRSKTEGTDTNDQLDEATQSDEGFQSGSVKDRPSVLMYLPEEIHGELDIRFDELNAKYKRAHGEKLEKNRDYYPAVVRAGLESSDLEDVLDI